MDGKILANPFSREMMPVSLIGIALISVIAYILIKSTRSSRKNLPPGPRPLPIIGNLLDFPAHGTRQELHWNKYKERYGPINYLNVFGQDIIVVNDGIKGKELLDKHSAKWSDRPVLTFAGEMCGFDQSMLLLQHNDQFRKMRKVAHNQLGSLTSLQKWSADIDIEVRRYLLRTLERPEKFAQHIRKEAGSIILKIVYGYHVEPHEDDRLVDLMEEVMKIFDQAVVPGNWLVDVLPALKFLPEWLPGMGFKRTARDWRKKVVASADVPFEFTQRQIADGHAPVSLLSESMKKLASDQTAEDVHLVKWAAVSMYAAGADTTVAQMEVFYLAMIMFPEVQRQAQAEIDKVVGKGRLPEPSDRPHLPYLEGVLKESIRWRSIGEVPPPHVSSEDDYFEGYFIPKGTMMLGNFASGFHDPNIYHDPDNFLPERHLGDNPEVDPLEYIFGFGRRICPGRWLATSNLWLQMTRTLAVFDIKAVKGKEPGLDFTYGATVKPVPFDADIRVRSAEHERLVREVATTNPFPAHGDGALL